MADSFQYWPTGVSSALFSLILVFFSFIRSILAFQYWSTGASSALFLFILGFFSTLGSILVLRWGQFWSNQLSNHFTTGLLGSILRYSCLFWFAGQLVGQINYQITSQMIYWAQFCVNSGILVDFGWINYLVFWPTLRSISVNFGQIISKLVNYMSPGQLCLEVKSMVRSFQHWNFWTSQFSNIFNTGLLGSSLRQFC